INTQVDGVLNQTIMSGDIQLHQLKGDLVVGHVGAPNGKIVLSADGSIVPFDATSCLQAKLVDLTSANGSIGSLANPLCVQVGYSDDPALRLDLGLNARAKDDIGIASKT